MTRRLALAVAALIAGLTLTACGTTPDTSSPDDTTDYTTTATVDPADDSTHTSHRRELTRMSIDVTWDASTPADQRNMCNGITLFGTDWAADELRRGAGNDSLDWDYAAQIIQGKCGL
ncbi:hypothetical protein [Streptomyces angustmyceticus]|uniref:hypothetical protein n=1 Tax=Streptomyces angustmyceticus TaxID=285578 RepID=UPI00344F0331